MSKFHTKSLVGFASLVALSCIACFSPPVATDDSGNELERSDIKRLAVLEETVAQLRKRIQNDKMTSLLSGHYWVEESRILEGEREKQSEELAWRLSTEL